MKKITAWIKDYIKGLKECIEFIQIMRIHSRMSKKADKAMKKWRSDEWWETRGY